MNNAVQEQLYVQYRDKVFSYIVSRINNAQEAEDLTSTVFVKVLSSFDTFDSSRASVSTWIYTITQNSLRDYLRRVKTQSVHTGYDENLEIIPYDDLSATGERLIHEEELESLADALNQLPQRERDIVVMRYYSGLSHKDIAQKMNLSYANVRFLNHKALEKLRGLMGDVLE